MMPGPRDVLEFAKVRRNAAHRTFRLHLDQVQEDLAARGVGGRIADRAGEAISDAAEVANEHKAVVAGTLAALVLWFLRRPLGHWLGSLWGSDDSERNGDDD